jgi:hypothetical protein
LHFEVELLGAAAGNVDPDLGHRLDHVRPHGLRRFFAG